MLLKIALRNIFRQKRRTLLTLLTMFGGFTLAAFSIGWSDGSYGAIIEMFTRNRLGHIQLHAKGYLEKPSIYKTIKNYTIIGQKITNIKGIEAQTPRVFAAGLAAVNDKSSGVQIIGVDPYLEEKATRFDKKVTNGENFSNKPMHTVIVGKGLAKILKAEINDELVLVSQAVDGSIANDIYKISGIIESGNDLSDRMSVYLHIKDAQEFLVLENRIHEIAVIVDDIDYVKKYTQLIEKEINNPNLSVKSWQEFARAFYQAMKVDQDGMWVMLLVIILIVAVGVLNTILMSVLERTREYGLLKAIGSRPLEVFYLVILEAEVLAFISIILGTGAGLILNYTLSIHGFTLPQSFTYGGVEFSTMYAEINFRSFFIPSVTTFLAASIVSIFPAIKAARVNPAKAMRAH